jgi:hypothetical protein
MLGCAPFANDAGSPISVQLSREPAAIRLNSSCTPEASRKPSVDELVKVDELDNDEPDNGVLFCELEAGDVEEM